MKYFLSKLTFYILVSEFMVPKYAATAYLVLDQDKPSLGCKPIKAMSLIQADCSNKMFDSIPNNLDKNIQVMVITNNRLRRLPSGSFSRYKSLEYLYLGQNIILELTEDTINELQYLEVLHLSDNALVDLPANLFELPYLRRLYLSKNELEDNTFNHTIKSPLELLEVAENHLTKIPSIGPQPQLSSLNLSRNTIGRISTEDLAPFCSLKTLDLTNNLIKFDRTTCDCYHFNAWTNIRNMKVTPSFHCDNATAESCSRIPFTNQTMESFEKCLDLIKLHAAKVKAKSTWIIVGCCFSAFIVCAMIGFYCRHKRNKKMNRKSKEEQRLAVTNANTELLNGNLPDQHPAKTTLHE